MTDAKAPAHERALSEIDDAVRAFFARGYYTARNPWRSFSENEDYKERRKQILIPDITIRKIVRRVAKQKKALWVNVEESGVDGYIQHKHTRHRIMFTRNKRSQVLAAPLIPVAVKHNWLAQPTPPVSFVPYETLWQFRFHGDEGEKIFRRWCERLQTDPTFIKALGFTPTGNPLLAPTEVPDDAQRLAA